MPGLFVAAMMCVALADTTAAIPVLALQPDSLLQRRMLDVADWQPLLGHEAMTRAMLQSRLTGIDAPLEVPAQTLAHWLEEAKSREAQFDSKGAVELRARIIATYDSMPLADGAISAVVAATMHEAAAAALAEGSKATAVQLAREALRRFSNTPLDARRHSPQVIEVFRRATALLRNAEHTELTVRTTAPGRVMLDGVGIGSAVDELTREVVAGRYMLWLEAEGGRSLARPIDVHGPSQHIEVDFALESALTWATPPVLDCRTTCVAQLATLAQRLDTPFAAGIEISAQGRAQALLVEPSGGVTRRELSALSSPVERVLLEPPPPTLSPLLFFPAGIGQFQQRRFVVGSAFAASQLGLAVWHVIALKRYSDTPTGDGDSERSRRLGVNLSAGLLIGAALTGIGEALLHHWLTSAEGGDG